MTTTRPNNKVCATCQSWHGERRFNALTGLIELDPYFGKVTTPCAMKYKRSGLASSANCRGFVKWCELP